MTDDNALPLPLDPPLVLDAPERPDRMEADTAAAIGASIVGSLCVLVSAIGLICVYVGPLGPIPAVLASLVTGLLIGGLLAGGLQAWLQDRAGRLS